jgi:Ca2+-binding EF-hand superfamily protein
MSRIGIPVLLLAVGSPLFAADPPSRHRGEFLRMWDAILSGQPPVAGFGWFGPAETRYTWDRLKKLDKNGDGRITKAEFGGPTELFEALDRDGDGAITPDDLDWSDDSTYARQLGMAQQLLRRADADGNRKVSREEWDKLFSELAKDKKDLDAEDLRRLLFQPSRGGPPPGMSGMPPKEVLLYGLLTGEIGSGAEGPKLNSPAPDFTLKSPDGKTTITLIEFRGKKSVALIFGNFT